MNKEIGSYRLVLLSKELGFPLAELEYDCVSDLVASYIEHKELQYNVMAFIDYVIGKSEELTQSVKEIGSYRKSKAKEEFDLFVSYRKSRGISNV